VNEAVLEMSGWSREQIVGQVCHRLICPAAEGECPISDLGENTDRSERVLLRRDGQAVPVLKRAVLITLDGRECILESFFDITDRKRAEEAVRYQAYHDGLTRLPNRQRFREELTQAIACAIQNGTKAAVLLLDLDRFKTINDTLGHSAGDKLLKAVADRLTTCLRSRDGVARFGGDEFAVLVDEMRDAKAAASVARRMQEALRPAFRIDGIELHTTASIGISVCPRDGLTAEELVQRADVALYQAKDQGRDTFRHYASWIDATAPERLALENDLRHALDRGEFILHYQPQIRVPTGRVVGLEALLRWQRPEMGLVMPREFIPLAEETGLMHPIGEWVVGEACRQSRAWQEAGLEPTKIAVNLSASQFRQEGLERVVGRELRMASLSPELLELEINETAVMMNVSVAAELMSRLKRVGVRLCLDDFGVGSTSLVHLKQFPIDTVKVDGSFVRAVETSVTDAAIVSAIIGIGESLDLLVIGEGVETPGQVQFLRERGCDTMQGFLLGRPVGAAEVEGILRESGVRSDGMPLIWPRAHAR
jgi:diguanylate cyclase (GGDEF)-like protein/PAS domain S-box-containing protein